LKITNATRPLEIDEYKTIIQLLNHGFTMSTGEIITPKPSVAIAFQLQANLGLRIGDVLRLKVANFRGNKLEMSEQKTGKVQWREINTFVSTAVKDYAIEKGLKPDDKLFDFTVRHAQKYLTKATQYLGINRVGTHSFRKMFATTVYEKNGHDLELVKNLLNHSSVAITQRYIRVSQEAMNEASRSIDFGDLTL